MLKRAVDSGPTNPDVRPETIFEVGDVQAFVLSLGTTGGSWAAGLLDWRGFLAVNLPLAGKALWAVLTRRSFREAGE